MNCCSCDFSEVDFGGTVVESRAEVFGAERWKEPKPPVRSGLFIVQQNADEEKLSLLVSEWYSKCVSQNANNRSLNEEKLSLLVSEWYSKCQQ